MRHTQRLGMIAYCDWLHTLKRTFGDMDFFFNISEIERMKNYNAKM